MPKIRHSHGNHPQKPPRSKWGTVLARYDRTGMLIAWQVRYPNPLEPGKRVQRQLSRIRSSKPVDGWKPKSILSASIVTASPNGFIQRNEADEKPSRKRAGHNAICCSVTM